MTRGDVVNNFQLTYFTNFHMIAGYKIRKYNIPRAKNLIGHAEYSTPTALYNLNVVDRRQTAHLSSYCSKYVYM